ncbi:hypoxanthine phosphoribosyltransferase [Spiroplasma chinense]|uniref:Hypoxanthine phosphoribosyltransferase n=1 Tax=Spiroplasma chinense TaxID=216932 RepID=A0A5B9Y4P2_9MOLU|nr:hypoxanthine phosphoribosyltransferase [Spiroplasma chinense]QEH61775.1 hypoxanthine phosphoribosyltransferase [Spiroplasma chinense]
MLKFQHNLKMLISKEEIQEKIAQYAKEINEKFKDEKEISVIGVMNGGVFFFTDFLRKIDLPIKMDIISASSYSGTSSTRELIFHKKVTKPIIEGKHVIIIEDILDTGLTMEKIYEYLLDLKPKSLQITVLATKPMCHPDFKYEYNALFEVPDKFIVGYGMETDDLYRQLEDIYVIEED